MMNKEECERRNAAVALLIALLRSKTALPKLNHAQRHLLADLIETKIPPAKPRGRLPGCRSQLDFDMMKEAAGLHREWSRELSRTGRRYLAKHQKDLINRKTKQVADRLAEKHSEKSGHIRKRIEGYLRQNPKWPYEDKNFRPVMKRKRGTRIRSKI